MLVDDRRDRPSLDRVLDLFDEVWGGTYPVAPASPPWHGYVGDVLGELLGPLVRAAGLVGTGPFNLGDENDYRVPGGYHRSLPSSVWVPTAAVVVEVISPDDETWAKFDFYAHQVVDEICTADPVARQLLNVTVADLSGQIAWPS